MRHFNIALGIMLALCLISCNQLPYTNITNIPVTKNTYTAETTFQKLANDYPFINIASKQVPSNIKEIKNQTYQIYNNRALQLDMYLPQCKLAQPRPAILFVHGGGWRTGDRSLFTPFAIAMAERGYVAATISYRLSPEAQYPAAIYDAKAAVRWLRKNATQFHINNKQIVIAGGSAGGQIASLVGVTNGIEKFDPPSKNSVFSSQVNAIINIDGLSNFTSEETLFYEDDPKKNPSSAGAWFGGRYNEKTDLWREASPLFYVNQSTPPILFLISSQKRFSLGYKEMTQKLSSFNIPYQVTQIPNSPHSFWLFDPWLLPSVEIVDAFLAKQFSLD